MQAWPTQQPTVNARTSGGFWGAPTLAHLPSGSSDMQAWLQFDAQSWKSSAFKILSVLPLHNITHGFFYVTTSSCSSGRFLLPIFFSGPCLGMTKVPFNVSKELSLSLSLLIFECHSNLKGSLLFSEGWRCDNLNSSLGWGERKRERKGYSTMSRAENNSNSFNLDVETIAQCHHATLDTLSPLGGFTRFWNIPKPRIKINTFAPLFTLLRVKKVLYFLSFVWFTAGMRW